MIMRIGGPTGNWMFSYNPPPWKGGRVVECAGLEIRCTGLPYRGFESHPFRQVFGRKKRANCFARGWIRKATAMPKAAAPGSRDVTESHPFRQVFGRKKRANCFARGWIRKATAMPMAAASGSRDMTESRCFRQTERSALKACRNAALACARMVRAHAEQAELCSLPVFRCGLECSAASDNRVSARQLYTVRQSVELHPNLNPRAVTTAPARTFMQLACIKVQQSVAAVLTI